MTEPSYGRGGKNRARHIALTRPGERPGHDQSNGHRILATKCVSSGEGAPATVKIEIPTTYALTSAVRGYRRPPSAGGLRSQSRPNLQEPGWRHRNSCRTGQGSAAVRLSADDRLGLRLQVIGSQLRGHGELLPSIMFDTKLRPAFRQGSWSVELRPQLLHARRQPCAGPAGPPHARPPWMERVHCTTATHKGVASNHGTPYRVILRVTSVPRDHGARTPQPHLALMRQ